MERLRTYTYSLARKVHRKDTPSPDLRLDQQFPLVTRQDMLDDGKAESGAR